MPDTFITNAHILVPSGWLEGDLLIQDGRIAAIGECGTDLRPSTFPAKSRGTSDAHGMALIPALVNGHTHLSQTFMRGLAGGRPLLRWLKELIWPLQGAMSEEVLELAALLGLAENIRSGAATVVDHQKITRSPGFTEAIVRAAQKSGLRVTIARAWSDRGNGAEAPQAILDELESFFSRTSERVNFASGPLTPWRASAETLVKTHALARQFNSFTHIHVSETAEEVEMTFKETGLRPVAWLDSLGILDPRCQIVHAVWVDEAEIGLLAEKRAPVVHCPVSNAVLGSGIAPVKAMLAKGIDLRLGTDGPASNDTQDCFENMKTALMLARASSLDAAAIAPRQALEMATASSGLTVGQPADLCLVNLDSVWSAPVHDFDSALALCARASDVRAVMVDGEWLMSDGKLTMLDEEVILKEAGSAVKLLRKKAGLDA